MFGGGLSPTRLGGGRSLAPLGSQPAPFFQVAILCASLVALTISNLSVGATDVDGAAGLLATLGREVILIITSQPLLNRPGKAEGRFLHVTHQDTRYRFWQLKHKRRGLPRTVNVLPLFALDSMVLHPLPLQRTAGACDFLRACGVP